MGNYSVLNISHIVSFYSSVMHILFFIIIALSFAMTNAIEMFLPVVNLMHQMHFET